MRESELNVLATPWVNTWVTYLQACCRANTSLVAEEVANQVMDPTNLNKIVKTKKCEKVKAFSSKVIHAQTTTMFMGCKLHVMLYALCGGDKPLPHGLAVHNMDTKTRTGSMSIVVVVMNLNATPIMLKKNAPLARVVAANAFPNAKIWPGMVEQLYASQRFQMGRPKMTMKQWKEALFIWLDLNGLDSWTPKRVWITLDWISDERKGDLKKILGKHAGSDEKCAVFYIWLKLTLHQEALYQWHMPTGKTGEILWFVSLKCTRQQLWMDVIEMQDTKVTNNPVLAARLLLVARYG